MTRMKIKLKAEKKKPKRMKKNLMFSAIVELFQKNPKAAFNYKQVSRLISVEGQVQKLQTLEILRKLVEDGLLEETDRGRFRINHRTTLAENADRTYIGALQVNKDYSFLITDDKNLANDIFIPPNKLNGAKNGDKAIVKITEWPENAKNPIGEVITVLGAAGDNNAEMHAILAEFGLPYKYPENVEQAAALIPEEITNEELADREDFREVTTFTIDPLDAKDFDDALSIRPTQKILTTPYRYVQHRRVIGRLVCILQTSPIM